MKLKESPPQEIPTVSSKLAAPHSRTHSVVHTPASKKTPKYTGPVRKSKVARAKLLTRTLLAKARTVPRSRMWVLARIILRMRTDPERPRILLEEPERASEGESDAAH